MPIVHSSHVVFDYLVADEMSCATIDLQTLRIQEFVWHTRIREPSTVYESMPWQRGIYAFIFGVPSKAAVTFIACRALSIVEAGFNMASAWPLHGLNKGFYQASTLRGLNQVSTGP